MRRRQDAVHVLAELGEDIVRGHRIGARAAVVLLDRFEARAVAQRDADRTLEALGSREALIDGEFDAVGEAEDARIAQGRFRIGILAQPAEHESFGQGVLQAHAAVRIRLRPALLRDRLADDPDDVGRDRACHLLYVVRRQAMRRAQRQDRVDIGMDDMRRRKRLERGVAALPDGAEAAGQPAVIDLRVGRLKV